MALQGVLRGLAACLWGIVCAREFGRLDWLVVRFFGDGRAEVAPRALMLVRCCKS